MTALATASSTSVASFTSPNRVSLQKGYCFTTSSTRRLCSVPTISNSFSSPLRCFASSSHFLGRFELLSLASKVDCANKSNSLTETLNAVKVVSSVSSTTTENGEVRRSAASNRRKEFRQERNHKRLNSSASQRNPLDHYQILKYPLQSESAIKNIANNNTLVFVVDKRADKKNIRYAAEKMLKIQTRKINTSIMPDGTKKAYLMLKPTDNASDIAKKIRVF